ncbi:hypothetical protein ABIA16_003766 [Sinorhizobium fredii]
MTPAITLWLAFVLAAGAIAWFGTRRQAIAFLVLALATAPATALPLGHAAPWQPAPGHYTVLGARIDIDEAIYVLLDDGKGEPRLYRLPYSAQQANGLQRAMDMAHGNGGTVGANIGEDGSPGFAEEGGQSEEPKQAEQPALRVAP